MLVGCKQCYSVWRLQVSVSNAILWGIYDESK